jgi:hypothetical protein
MKKPGIVVPLQCNFSKQRFRLHWIMREFLL